MKKPTDIVFSKSERELFRRVKEQLDADAHPYKNLQLFAQTMGVNIKKLKAGFKQLNGVGIYQYLLNVRIEKAKKLLLQDQLSIKAIASECGFRNYQHFVTTFKKRTGSTPGKYIAAIRLWMISENKCCPDLKQESTFLKQDLVAIKKMITEL